jgi:hypothetical protein
LPALCCTSRMTTRRSRNESRLAGLCRAELAARKAWNRPRAPDSLRYPMPLYPPTITPRETPRRQHQRVVIPAELTKEMCKIARRLRGKFASLFVADRRLKRSVARLLETQLPPRGRRRGRPGFPKVTQALRMFADLRRSHPGEPAQVLWSLVLPYRHKGYGTMKPAEQRDAEQQLR